MSTDRRRIVVHLEPVAEIEAMRTVPAIGLPLLLALLLAAVAAALPALTGAAQGAEQTRFELVLKEHRFEPAELEVPAGKRITLVIRNADATPEEFESHDLRVEKVVPGSATVTLRVGPLKPGQYKFVGEYHEDTAKGTVIAE
jgi:plastocyanin